MKVSLVVSAVAVLLGLFSVMPSRASAAFVPKAGFVPTETTAVTIAEAIAIAIYGEEQIAAQRPLKAILRKDVWTVQGTPPSGAVAGGVVEVRISKKDARVLSVTHGR
jgi:hypothetical protein